MRLPAHPVPPLRSTAVEHRGSAGDLLHRLVSANLSRFYDAAEARSRSVPAFVRRELEGFIRCGDFTEGFAQLHCPRCDHHRLVPFTCGGRGFCPTCGGRRMSEQAAWLVDRVLPHRVPLRQWVLTVPWPRRLLLARRHDLARGVLRIGLQAIFAWYKDRAREHHGLAPSAALHCGSVTAIQRFGGSLNLNLHFHCLLLNGAYRHDPQTGALRFFRVPAPTTEEVATLVETIATRAERYLARQGFGQDPEEADLDLDEDEDDAQQLLQAASIAGRSALGPRAGHKPRHLRTLPGRPFRLPPRCAAHGDYNLHANVLVGGHDRQAIEQAVRRRRTWRGRKTGKGTRSVHSESRAIVPVHHPAGLGQDAAGGGARWLRGPPLQAAMVRRHHRPSLHRPRAGGAPCRPGAAA